MRSEFEVLVDAQAARDLKSLSRRHHPILPRLKRRIDSLAHEPFLGKPLKGGERGCYSLRDGDFRVIYEVFEERRVVLVIRVGDRKEIYR